MLREWVANSMGVASEQIWMTNGAQQAMSWRKLCDSILEIEFIFFCLKAVCLFG
ncbi:MAG: hypothetical protein JKY66_06555 [Spongiibacteraceae bacterium]|nr:hypothetical protein [Spongiibacteraceae bacterium]